MMDEHFLQLLHSGILLDHYHALLGRSAATPAPRSSRRTPACSSAIHQKNGNASSPQIRLCADVGHDDHPHIKILQVVELQQRVLNVRAMLYLEEGMRHAAMVKPYRIYRGAALQHLRI